MDQLKKFGKILMLATLIPIAGCVTNEEDSGPNEEKVKLKFGNESNINILNLVDYAFKGSCTENGENNISFSIKSSENEKDPLKGTTNCIKGKWEFSLSAKEWANLADGELTVTLSLANFSITLKVLKDLIPPTLVSLIRAEDGTFSWDCDGVCPKDYTYRRAVTTSSVYKFADDMAFSKLSSDMFLEGVNSNGEEDLYAHLQVRDPAGNLSEIVSTSAFRYDNTAPYVSSASASSDNSINNCLRKGRRPSNSQCGF